MGIFFFQKIDHTISPSGWVLVSVENKENLSSNPHGQNNTSHLFEKQCSVPKNNLKNKTHKKLNKRQEIGLEFLLQNTDVYWQKLSCT